jgi:hypothetical protein
MLSLPKESPPQPKKGCSRGYQNNAITWHWLIKKHPVEFSKNNHTPTPQPPTRGKQHRGNRSNLHDQFREVKSENSIPNLLALLSISATRIAIAMIRFGRLWKLVRDALPSGNYTLSAPYDQMLDRVAPRGFRLRRPPGRPHSRASVAPLAR